MLYLNGRFRVLFIIALKVGSGSCSGFRNPRLKYRKNLIVIHYGGIDDDDYVAL
jgi:hypothetical protein